MTDVFPLRPGVPMHLLVERGLNEAFLDVVERHRREDLPVVLRRNGELVSLPVDQLRPEIQASQRRIAELNAELSKYETVAGHTAQPAA